uniref:uncharacterized protein LOC120345964 isoform X2 n=1 Tax=Styela clava TaxID=7725 RepID=UPI001939F000|nr:uncharacterized protein LOC120345964 isoform X2 [Styela clava]
MVGRKRARRSCSYCKATDHNVRTCGVKALVEVDGERKLLQWLATSNEGNSTEPTYENVVERTFTEHDSTRQAGIRYQVFGPTVRDLLPTTAASPRTDGLRDGSFQNPGGMVWLQKVCHLNNFHLVDNAGGGDCAYISILDGIRALGLPNKPDNIEQFRYIVADELSSRPNIYRDLLETDSDHRDSEFNTFVSLTRSTREWAQTCCFYAIAALFPITIRLWDDRTKHFGSFGTFPQVVNIGYLSDGLHYVALLPSLSSADNLSANDLKTCRLGNEQSIPRRNISASALPPEESGSIQRRIQNMLEDENCYDHFVHLPRSPPHGFYEAIADSLKCASFRYTVKSLRRRCWMELSKNVRKYQREYEGNSDAMDYGEMLRGTLTDAPPSSLHFKAAAAGLSSCIHIFDVNEGTRLCYGKDNKTFSIRIAKADVMFWAVLPRNVSFMNYSTADAHVPSEAQSVEQADAYVPLTFSFQMPSTSQTSKRTERPDKPEYPLKLQGVINATRTCANCCRNNTTKYNIFLRSTSQQLRRKKYGYISRGIAPSPQVLLCELCCKYLTSTFNTTKQSWFCSWPSALWSFLSMTDVNVSNIVWSVLPTSIREMWRCMNLNNTECRFMDRTHDINKINSLVATYDIGFITEAFNAFPVADVICPLGCWEFVENCDFIPFLHYLEHITDLKLSGSDPDAFRGARPDWPPSPTKYLDRYVCAAGISVSDQHGLCILWCKDKHDSLKRPTLHPPTNPVLRPNADQGCDFLAPCTLIPHLKRLGKIKQWNSSGHVLDVRGGHFGMSSCSLNPNPSKMSISRDQHMVNSLIVGQRNDIRKRLFRDHARSRDAESYLLTYDVDRRERAGVYDEELIQKHLTSGTYVSEVDAYYMWRAKRAQQVQTSQQSGDDFIDTTKMFIVIVHPADSFGCKPFQCQLGTDFSVNANYSNNENNRNSWSPAGLISFVLIHCRQLYNSALMQAVEQKDQYAAAILSTVAFIEKFQNRSKFCMTKIVFQKSFENTLRPQQQRDGYSEAHIVANILSTLVCLCVTSITDDFDCPLGLQLKDEEILLIVRPPFSRKRCTSPPHYFMGRHLIMLLSSKHGHAFRWDHTMRWWLVVKKLVRQCHILPHLPSWQLAIYGATTDAVDGERLSRSLDGQQLLKCGNVSHHDFLVKESRYTLKQCFKRTCTNKAVWGCHWSYLGTQCNVGICRSHFMSEIRNGEVVEIQCEDEATSIVSMDEGNVSDSNIINIASEDSDDFVSDDDNDASRSLLHQSNFDFLDDEVMSDPLHTISTNVPTFNVDSNYFPLHLLLNDTFQVLKRSVRRRKNARSQNLLHHFASNTDSTMVSLLFPEAQILPTTFWAMKRNSPIGAMHQAHFCHSGSSGTIRALRSKNDMIGIRIRDHNLPTSQQHSNLHFYFDLKLNDKLNKNSSALVFRRGLEHIAENESLHCLVQDSPLPYDESDTNVKIRELTALTTKYPWKYWMTMTCNEYLVYSPDQPAGPIHHMFARLEFQSTGSPGNKAHVHIGAALFDEDEKTTLSRISCNPETVFNDESFGVTRHQLMRKGIVKNSSDFDDLKKLYFKMSTHDCSRAGERCMKRKNEKGEVVCRVPRHPTSSQFFFQEKHNLYCTDMMERMRRIGFADNTNCRQLDGSISSKLTMIDPRLRGGRYHYPTRSPPTYLPTIPLLQCALGSSFNCTACDRRFATSYLIKYHVGKESHSGSKYLKGHEKGNVKINDGGLKHVKISGQQLLDDNIKNRDSVRGLAVTEIGYYEMNTFINDASYTTSTANFIHVNTNPPEYRVWRVKSKKGDAHQFNYGITGGRSPFIDCRLVETVPHWRRFTANQQLHAREYAESQLSYSNTEKFNIRPPELLSVNKLLAYHEIFVYTGNRATSNLQISLDPLTDRLLDACGYEVKIRRSGLVKLRHFLQDNFFNSSSYSNHMMSSRNFLADLVQRLSSKMDVNTLRLSNIFVHDKDSKETVAVSSYVHPNRKINFLYHLVLTLGHYETEFDLFHHTNSFRDVFIRARLLSKKPEYNQDDADIIFKLYMDTEALHLPITRRKLERFTKIADDLITQIVCGSDEIGSTTPPISELAIRHTAEEDIAIIENVRRLNLIDTLRNALVNAGITSLPTAEDVFRANLAEPLYHWIPLFSECATTSLIPRSDHQTDESYFEQVTTFELALNALKAFMHPQRSTSCCRFPCIVGPPGAGKTFLIQLLAFVSLSLGYRVSLLSLTSERARSLGGIHIHQVFPLPVTEKYNKSPDKSYCHMMQSLSKSGKKMVLLQRTDIFIFEEIGLISAEIYAMMDRCMKEIMSSDESFGHKFVIANGDPCQLPPPRGSPFWTSIHFMASFKAMSLKHFVRSASDKTLQRVITLLRQPSLQQEHVRDIVTILSNSCNFVDNWDRVPEESMRIVSTRKAEQMVIEDFLTSKRNDPNVTLRKFVAIDEVHDGSTWGPATPMQSNQITRQVLEPKEISLFKGSVLRLTYNNNSGNPNFSQGQLCVVQNFIHSDERLTEITVRVKLVPPGERCLSTINSNWKDFILRTRYTADVLLSGRTHARRLQLPVRYYKANTIHRVMGETCRLVATEINNQDRSKRHLRLWEKSQLLVLISRVPTLSSLYFVGDRSETIDTLGGILQIDDYWTSHISERLVVNINRQSRFISNSDYPYSFCAKEIPVFKSGVVYLLISLPFPNVSYLGQTGRNIKRRIAEHNAGNGTTFTSQVHYMPWTPLAIIYGFSDNISAIEASNQRRHVERTIRSHLHLNFTPEAVMSVIVNLLSGNITLADRMEYYGDLIVERLGRLRVHDNNGFVATEDTES